MPSKSASPKNGTQPDALDGTGHQFPRRRRRAQGRRPKRTAGSDPGAVARDSIQGLIDLHFVVRDRIGDVLGSPRVATLDDVRAVVHEFLETERRLVVLDPELINRFGIDLSVLMRGRRAVRRSLDRLARSEAVGSAAVRATQALRLSFLDHVSLYSRHRRAGHHASSPTSTSH